MTTVAINNATRTVTISLVGTQGSPGSGGGGSSLSNASPQSLGTAAPGTSILASRDDHVHAMPNAAAVGADAAGAASTAQASAIAAAASDATTKANAAQAAAIAASDPTLIPQNSQSANYTLVLSDKGKSIYHPPADTIARTWTIPANASVPFVVGTVITFDNDFGAGAITIAITTDTLVLVGAAGTTGSRMLAPGGVATAVKVAATRWRVNGTGLT
jgi:hypothetical protein